MTGQLKGRRHLGETGDGGGNEINVPCVRFSDKNPCRQKLQLKCSKPRTRMAYKANKHDQQHGERCHVVLTSSLLTCAGEHCCRTHVRASATCPDEQLIYAANHSIWMAAVVW